MIQTLTKLVPKISPRCMAGVNKRGFQDGSPTGVSPPYKRSGSDPFVDNFVKAITDERVVSALQAIFVQTITNDLKRRDDKIEH